jgi:hypothetical protein
MIYASDGVFQFSAKIYGIMAVNVQRIWSTGSYLIQRFSPAGHEILYLESLKLEGGAVFGGWPVL